MAAGVPECDPENGKQPSDLMNMYLGGPIRGWFLDGFWSFPDIELVKSPGSEVFGHSELL